MAILKSNNKNTNSSEKKNKKGILFIIPFLLLFTGLSLITYGGWNLFKQTYLVGKIFFSEPPAPVSEKQFQINNVTTYRPKYGSEMGTLTIPSISLNYPIIHGDDDDALSKGVGQYAQGPLPGENGNVVLAGHRDTVFTKLGNAKIGDTITIKTNYGTYNYKISKTRIVDKNDLTVVVPSDKEMLTIYTCYPFNFIGHAPQRYVVLADFVGSSQDSTLTEKQMQTK